MNKLTLSIMSLALAGVASVANAAEMDMNGIPVKIKLHKPHVNGVAASPEQAEFYLIPVDLTKAQKHHLLNERLKTTHLFRANNLPSKANQGMNDVPVLNQGSHGTCATFATVAALDALIGKKDYVSELCNLELGSYLENNAYTFSGWNGSWGPLVLEQSLRFGIVSRDNQHQKACGGVAEYPLYEPRNNGKPVSVEDFHKVAENIQDSITWSPILTGMQSFGIDPLDRGNDPETVLAKVKQLLAAAPTDNVVARKITFGTLLPVDYCEAGSCGTRNQLFDSWVLTDDIAADTDPYVGGHEMVIYGYDDDAVAIDSEGKEHKGLLTIRNSWSQYAGDNGDYYMSYDFFKKFVLEVQLVEKIIEPEMV